MCMDIDAPADRSYGAETRSNLKAQVKLAPDLYKAEAEYQPKYGELSRQQFNDMLMGKEGGAPGLLDLYRDQIGPAMRDSARAGATSQREGDVSDIETYGQRAVDAIQGANPGQKRLLDMLTSQAGDELALGSSLDPSQAREAEQGMRSARAARGMGYGGGDANLETMARLLKGEKTRAQRRGFATQVAGLNQAAGIDPMLAVTGRPGMVAQPGAFGGPSGGGPSLFNPETAYGQDVWNTNYNANAAAKISEGNANAALYSAAIGAAGQAASSF